MAAASGFEFLDAVTSDLAFRARGATPEALFAACADALLAATVERPEAVHAVEERRVELAEPDLELLLLRFLNELVYLRDAEGLLLRVRSLRLHGCGVAAATGPSPAHEPATLEAVLTGEPIEARRHRLLTDVKAATAHGLRVEQTSGGGWEARVTLDV